MPTKITAQAPLVNSVGGGNLGLFEQIAQQADGTFAALTGTDCIGDPAGTVHILGSQIDSAFNRNDKGQYSTPVTIIENDIDRLNMLEAVAPYNPLAVDNNPEDVLEDGTIIGGTTSVYGDPTLPFFLFTLFTKPTAAGKERARVFVGQFSRAGGFDQKAKQRNKLKMTVVSVDAQGFTPLALPAHARTTGMAAVALASNYRQGIWIQGT